MTQHGSPPPWEIESSEQQADYAMYSVRRVRARSPRNGSVHDFDVVDAPDGVTVVAFTPEGGVVLVEQYRVPIRRVNLETPSGVIDEGEAPVEAGKRELREETGYVAERARSIGTLVLNPSWETTRVHVVVAEDARREAATDLDEAEDTRVRVYPLAEVEAMVRDGRIDSATAVAALHLLELHRRAE